ncbi:RNA polymerase sigma factor [Tamaricihabitans halophyticus]|uniref:RNA polymerase sigma factor n=1 Tax=Tamaricihabitans halophyticus TaxID=1262583 RepID=UPI0010504608|nr:sigma-70 family RNA polymerase sigma factor [Tamaricihabitans halophyticus]
MSEPRVRPDPAFALLEIYAEALPQVYGYLRARCGNTVLAEDLTSATFLGAVDTARRGAVAVSVSWLIGIARHKLADHWRSVEREERGLRLVYQAREETAAAPSEQLEVLVARQVLAELGAHHRAALTLRYLDGLPVPEVAAHLDRTVHATEALLVRARAAFRKAYQRRGGQDD